MVNFTLVSVGTFSCDIDLVDLSVLVLAADLVAVDLVSAFEVVDSDFFTDFLSALSDAVFFLSDVVVTSVLVFSLSFFSLSVFGSSVVCFLTGLVVEFWLLLAATLGLLVTGGRTGMAPAEEPAKGVLDGWVSVCANAEFAIISPTSPITSSPVVLLTW